MLFFFSIIIDIGVLDAITRYDILFEIIDIDVLEAITRYDILFKFYIDIDVQNGCVWCLHNVNSELQCNLF